MINNISFYSIPNTFSKSNRQVSFGHNVQTLMHKNIGSCAEGYIGKIRVRKGNEEAYLNVFKKYLGENVENYTIKNDNNEIIGNADIYIINCQLNPYTREDPSYVMVDDLRNFSKPNTPYHNENLEYFKDIGTRLLQIAQRRSEEALCNGNIRVIPLKRAFDWYKNVIGMRQLYNDPFMYLPPESKEALSKLQGGL